MSVIIPAYNASATIRETLASLRDQTMPQWRAIVVNDGSTDATVDVVNAFADPRVTIVSQENRGLAGARNTGLRHAWDKRDSDDCLVSFLDADDTIAPMYATRMLDALDADPQADIVACAFEFRFLGGSMGSVVGERFVRGVETAIEQKVPFICFTATGGARMQEGLLSLMQMAKTNAALTRLAKKGLPYISVLTDPTMGGVSAGFAFVGDIVIAEPKALIGFAGPRVIENTVRVTLPEGFQRAEFLMQKGAVDLICDRRELRNTIASSLAMLQRLPADAVA